IFQTLDIGKNENYASHIEEYSTHFQEYAVRIRSIRKKQIKRIKKGKVGTRNSILYLHLLSEFRNMALFAHRILRVLEDVTIDQPDDEDIDVDEFWEEMDRI
ncbi:MAG: hypothetical protein K8F30_09440, partial [Taibaiella sp.]|nr:hypothetical protein [Taibaiella sp.]